MNNELINVSKGELMKKLIITMIAIAFSLSAFSQMRILEESGDIRVWCINENVFMENKEGGLIQVMGFSDSGGIKPLPCRAYRR